MPESTPRLWEPKHTYYCESQNYFRPAGSQREVEFAYDSWAEFVDGWGAADMDLNLAFRWDWQRFNEEYATVDLEEGEDITDRRDTLLVFFMIQRKGYHTTASIRVTEEDEGAIREWLLARWHHLAALWAPLSNVEAKP